PERRPRRRPRTARSAGPDGWGRFAQGRRTAAARATMPRVRSSVVASTSLPEHSLALSRTALAATSPAKMTDGRACPDVLGRSIQLGDFGRLDHASEARNLRLEESLEVRGWTADRLLPGRADAAAHLGIGEGLDHGLLQELHDL